jgi:hypothetical protein
LGPQVTRAASLILPLFVFGCARATLSKSDGAASEVRLAEEQRFAAMTKQDMTALDTLLDEDLTYVHSTGELQSKPAFIALLKSRKLVYESITPSDVRVRAYDGIAVATGRSQMQLRATSGEMSFRIRFTEVYIRRGGRWLLTAWESARLAS